MTVGPNPTDPFTSLKPQNISIDSFYVVHKRRLDNLEASKLYKGRSRLTCCATARLQGEKQASGISCQLNEHFGGQGMIIQSTAPLL